MTIQRRAKPPAPAGLIGGQPPMAPSPVGPLVMIATPAYGGMVHVDYVNSLLTYQRAGIAYSLATIGNESLITRARNTLLSMFWANEAFTHLLFLDADVSLPAESLQHMLTRQRDVIGAPVALKGRDAQGGRIFNVGRCVGEAGEHMLVEHIGTAALMLSRKAVASLIQQATERGGVYGVSPQTQRGAIATDMLMYDVFQVGVLDGVYLSEDYWVCRQLRELGFDIHVQLDAVTQHHGVMPA